MKSKKTEYKAAIKLLNLSEDYDAPYKKAALRESKEQSRIDSKQKRPAWRKSAGRAYGRIKKVSSSLTSFESPTEMTSKIYRKIWPARKLISFAAQKSPDVSIVIPIYNKVDITTHCLKALANHKSKYTFEVVLVDNASQDESQSRFSNINGLIYLRNAENFGFVGGCNIGADKAKGKYLVFLNNDTEVQGEWLDALIDTLQSDNNIGLVGSKLVYPDGRLQEAGGIIFRNGSGMNYGKNGDPGYFEYNYSREVDYCSGASIVLEKKLFDRLDKFDELYSPAYYEDTDLAFKVRNSNLKVIYEPKSVVKHFEGATAGTSTSSGFKKYQDINHKKFVKKWDKVLSKNHFDPAEAYRARDRSGKRLALIIDTIVPETDKDSGSVRMHSMIKVLQGMDYKVTFWPENLYATQPYTPKLQSMGVEVVYGTVSFEQFSRDYAKFYDLVIVSRPDVAVKFIKPCLQFYKHAKIIYDTVDLAFLRLDRQAKTENSEKLTRAAAAWKIIELNIINSVDNTLVVSDFEKELLHNLLPSKKVNIVSNIHCFKTLGKPYKARSGLFFIANFQHLPNQDSMEWFANSILSQIKNALPNISISVVGPHMPTRLKSMLEDKGVKVHGFVEDVEPLLASSRVFISPLRYGAGVKGKVGQAIEYGLPVVTTSIGAEGMHLRDGESCLIADDAKSFAGAVVYLYKNERKWHELQKNSSIVLEKYFSPAAARKELVKIID